MTLVFQCRLSEAETEACDKQPRLLDDIELVMVVTMETAQQVSDKPIRGEITDPSGGRVLKVFP